MNEKDRRLAQFCRSRRVDGAVLRRRSNIAWITDGADVQVDASTSLGVATLLWTPKRKRVFTDIIEARRLRDEEFGRDWEIVESPWWTPPRLPAGHFACDWPDDILVDVRASLTAHEAKRLRALGAESAATLEATMKAVRRGWCEREVAGRIDGELRSLGIQPVVTLIAADGRIARYRHPIPTANRVEKQLVVSICAQRHGLVVCLTRLLHFGKLSADLRRRHEAVCRIDSVLQAATRPGARWCEILAGGIAAYRETGFADEWKRHHQGGPMGYEPRDFKATLDETRAVVKSQAVGWNPSIAGTKSEDTILSTGEVVTVTREWPMESGRPGILTIRRS